MKRAIAVVASLAALAACRSIVGIEDLGVDASTGATSDASSPAEGGADAGSDALQSNCRLEPPPPNGRGCGGCCVGTPGDDVRAWIDLAKANGCICGGQACTSECGNSVCGNGGPPLPGCVQCLEAQVGSSNVKCEATRAQCADSGPCTRFLACMTGCR